MKHFVEGALVAPACLLSFVDCSLDHSVHKRKEWPVATKKNCEAFSFSAGADADADAVAISERIYVVTGAKKYRSIRRCKKHKTYKIS